MFLQCFSFIVPFKIKTPTSALQKADRVVRVNNESELSLSTNFIDFLNNSTMSTGGQSGQTAYLDIIQKKTGDGGENAKDKDGEESQSQTQISSGSKKSGGISISLIIIVLLGGQPAQIF